MLSALIAFTFTVNHERDPRYFKDLLQVSCCSSRQALVLAENKLRDHSSVDDVQKVSQAFRFEVESSSSF